MSQPNWKLIANLGDSHPIEYGGCFVFEDTTGIYPAEMELVEPPPDEIDLDDPKARWTTYRVILEPCTLVNGVLSDNPYHPDIEVWFADSLADIARSMDADDLHEMLCSDIPINRAIAYQAIFDYHGWDNGDAYPNQYTRAEIEARIAQFNATKGN